MAMVIMPIIMIIDFHDHHDTKVFFLLQRSVPKASRTYFLKLGKYKWKQHKKWRLDHKEILLSLLLSSLLARHLVPVQHHQGLDDKDSHRRKGWGHWWWWWWWWRWWRKMLVILSPSSTTRVWITKVVVGGNVEDNDGDDGDGDDEGRCSSSCSRRAPPGSG